MKRTVNMFGKEIPALLVYQEGEQYAVDVYPHEKRGGFVYNTIVKFLNALVEEHVQDWAPPSSGYRRIRRRVER
ncbi:hypothetical protein ACFLU4_04000 [Chloroflexota bacterium]